LYSFSGKDKSLTMRNHFGHHLSLFFSSTDFSHPYLSIPNLRYTLLLIRFMLPPGVELSHLGTFKEFDFKRKKDQVSFSVNNLTREFRFDIELESIPRFLLFWLSFSEITFTSMRFPFR
jgi:hypothetical protein